MLGISKQGGAGHTPVTEYLDVRWVGIMNTAEMKTNGPLAAPCAPTPVPCLSLFSFSQYLDSQNNAKVKGTEVRMEERPSCKTGNAFVNAVEASRSRYHKILWVCLMLVEF